MSKVVHSGNPDELDFVSYLSHTQSFFADGEYSLCIYMVCCAIGKSCMGLNRCI